MKKMMYTAPEASLLAIEVEQGFVGSSPEFSGSTPSYGEDDENE